MHNCRDRTGTRDCPRLIQMVLAGQHIEITLVTDPAFQFKWVRALAGDRMPPARATQTPPNVCIYSSTVDNTCIPHYYFFK